MGRLLDIFMVGITIVVMVVTLSAVSDEAIEELRRQQNECYSKYGEENITYEYFEDGYYHAEINGTLVYAHGQFVNGTCPSYGLLAFVHKSHVFIRNKIR